MDKTFKEIIEGFSKFPEVQAIALGGSRATKTEDSGSDIDIEIFVSAEVPIDKRYNFIKNYSKHYELGCNYFGSGDEFFVEKMKQQLDVAYFSTKWIEDDFKNVFKSFEAKNGYTTCFLFTIKNCEILYDKNGWLQDLKDELDKPYPKLLKENIISRNLMLLKDKPFASYYEQIQKAILRNDLNSINHRITAFMASYFDIIFANNELLHPGEKRLIDYALKHCAVLPCTFKKNIEALYMQPNPNTLEILDDMVLKLKRSLKRKKKVQN